MEKKLEKTIANLQKNNMNVVFLQSKQEVVPYLRNMLPVGSTVAASSSVSLEECGVFDLIGSDEYQFFDRHKPGLSPQEYLDVVAAGHNADFYFTSSNAITVDGELYNVDGRGNRVAAMANGRGKLIYVVGVNKIVDNLNEAILRVKKIAAPINTRRLGYLTYCNKMGECLSIKEGRGSEMTAGCASDLRICCQYLVSRYQRVSDRVTIVLVNEKLGY